jgi:hypothetical protein
MANSAASATEPTIASKPRIVGSATYSGTRRKALLPDRDA